MVRVFTQLDGRRLDLPGRSSRQVVSAENGAKSVTIRVVEIAPAEDGLPRGPHVHDGFEECIYVLSGTGITETESGTHAVGAGDCVLVSAGELHVTRNIGSDPLVLLCFFPVNDVTPGTREFGSWDLARTKP